jgi:hypothetical protein
MACSIELRKYSKGNPDHWHQGGMNSIDRCEAEVSLMGLINAILNVQARPIHPKSGRKCPRRRFFRFGRTSTRLPPHLLHLARRWNEGTSTSSG